MLFALCALPLHAAQKSAADNTTSGKTAAKKKAKAATGKKAANRKTSARKKAARAGKQRGKASAKNSRVYATRSTSGKIMLDRRITATRKLLAQDQGHELVHHQRGENLLSPINFPDLALHRDSPNDLSMGRSTFSVARQAGLNKTADPLSLSSSAVYVLDQSTQGVIFRKNANVPLPMASITKLMTGLVVVESMQDMSEIIEISREDAARALGSRLKVGSRTTRGNLLHLALMSSENRAAAALGRHFPGGYAAFVAAMNLKAQALGMTNTHYEDTTGLSSNNVASAEDLAKLVMAAAQYPILRQFSTDTGYVVKVGYQPVQYSNTNSLVHNPNMNIDLQKTGFTSAAGNCLVMQAVVAERPIVMVFLDANGKDARIADVIKIRNWIRQSNHTVANNKPHV